MKCSEPELGELLGAYEEGWLEGEEKKRLEAHLERCQACQRELYEMIAFFDAVRANAANLASRQPAGMAGHARISHRLTRALRRAGLPLALAACLLLGSAIWLVSRLGESNQPRQAEAPNYAALVAFEKPAEMLGEPRGELLGDPEFVQGMKRYKAGDFKRAAKHLERVVSAHPDDPQIRFYLGVCYAMIGAYGRAAAQLESALRGADDATAKSSRWHLANVYLAIGKVGAAREQLLMLAKGANGHASRARALLEKLDAVKQ